MFLADKLYSAQSVSIAFDRSTQLYDKSEALYKRKGRANRLYAITILLQTDKVVQRQENANYCYDISQI